MSKYKIIAIFGKSGSGKDTLLKSYCEVYPQCNKIITTTTRPKRDYEIDGKDYHFLSTEDFAKKVLSGDLIEATCFNNWWYGTDIHELKEENIGVFNIQGIECMLEDSRLQVFPIYVQASDKTRLLRSLMREENPDCAEICRRYKTDEEDFADIPFEYKIFDNENNNGLK